MPLNAQQIAAEVRAELARQNKTHRDVAAWLDLAQPSVTLRIQGRRAFRAEEIATIAAHLGVPVGQFFEGRASATPASTDAWTPETNERPPRGLAAGAPDREE